jgi:hypothetical protein
MRVGITVGSRGEVSARSDLWEVNNNNNNNNNYYYCLAVLLFRLCVHLPTTSPNIVIHNFPYSVRERFRKRFVFEVFLGEGTYIIYVWQNLDVYKTVETRNTI